MMERRQVVEFWQGGLGSMLVTLVGVEGSSYRQRGARLIAGLNGYAGTISGGCPGDRCRQEGGLEDSRRCGGRAVLYGVR